METSTLRGLVWFYVLLVNLFLFGGLHTMKPSEIRDKISEDFDPFWEAIKDELVRHYPEKGDSWKASGLVVGYYHRYSSSPSPPIHQDMVEHLEGMVEKIHQKYRRSKDPHELVDKTAVNAMIWLHKKGFVKK